jgi:hypothetical protein
MVRGRTDSRRSRRQQSSGGIEQLQPVQRPARQVMVIGAEMVTGRPADHSSDVEQ